MALATYASNCLCTIRRRSTSPCEIPAVGARPGRTPSMQVMACGMSRGSRIQPSLDGSQRTNSRPKRVPDRIHGGSADNAAAARTASVPARWPNYPGSTRSGDSARNPQARHTFLPLAPDRTALHAYSPRDLEVFAIASSGRM